MAQTNSTSPLPLAAESDSISLEILPQVVHPRKIEEAITESNLEAQSPGVQSSSGPSSVRNKFQLIATLSALFVSAKLGFQYSRMSNSPHTKFLAIIISSRIRFRHRRNSNTNRHWRTALSNRIYLDRVSISPCEFSINSRLGQILWYFWPEKYSPGSCCHVLCWIGYMCVFTDYD